MKFINESGREYYVDKFDDMYYITSYPVDDESVIIYEGEFESETIFIKYWMQ